MNALFRCGGLSFLLGLVLCCPSRAHAQGAEGQRKLTVSSSATVYADADTAVISFAVLARAPTTKEARDRTGKRTATIRDAIANLKLTGVTVDVVPEPLHPLVSATPAVDGTENVQGYQAKSRLSVTVRVKDTEKLRALVAQVGDVAMENGAIGLSEDRVQRLRLPMRLRGGLGGAAAPEPPEEAPGPSVEWLCENATAARQLAVKRAVEQALANARAVTGAARPKVLEVEVQSTHLSEMPYSLRNAAPPHLGRVPVGVTVRVICSY